MEFDISRLMEVLNKEYINYVANESDRSRIWSDFIEYIDLGIVFDMNVQGSYKITDERKWMLTRIKYGI